MDRKMTNSFHEFVQTQSVVPQLYQPKTAKGKLKVFKKVN